jgi:excisionase family DNA binding protein
VPEAALNDIVTRLRKVFEWAQAPRVLRRDAEASLLWQDIYDGPLADSGLDSLARRSAGVLRAGCRPRLCCPATRSSARRHGRQAVGEHCREMPEPTRRLAAIPPPSVAIDFGPLADAVVARLRPLLVSGAESRPQRRAFRMSGVAELLSISQREVERLVSDGELASISVGRIRLIPSSAIDDWLQHKLAESRRRDPA